MISDIAHAVCVGTTLNRSWFRGHANEVGELTPRVFRKDIDTFPHMSAESRRVRGALMGRTPTDRGAPELRLIDAFKRSAPALTETVPPPDHNAEWLFLMQHHGLPTRLLDWSESVLVALYFATDGDDNEDGELWQLLPPMLNEKHEGHPGPWMPTSGNSILKYLVNEPLYSTDELCTLTRLKEPPKYPLALQPTMTFARVAAQSSTFTIHPRPCSGNTIRELLTDRKYLCCYTIPAKRKAKLRKDLASLGITCRSLFQDLESLSKTLEDELRIIGYAPPDPPKFPLNE